MHSHEDLLTAFSLSAVLRLRRRFQALAELYRQQKGNTSCEAANRRSEKNAFSEAASIFPLRLPLRGLKGASSPFLVDPARRNRWCFSGSPLARKRELSPAQKRSSPAPARAAATPFYVFAQNIAICVFNAQATSANCISQICHFDRHYF